MSLVQLLGLRKFINKSGEEVAYDAFHDQKWRAESLAHLFQNLEQHIEKIPPGDRWNIFYTVANCGDGKREFESQGVLVWDVDGIDQGRFDQYAPLVAAALGVRHDEYALVNSGNGLHFIIELKKHITDGKWFKKHKPHYKAICSKINLALEAQGLPGATDTTVFEPRRILRLPGTINRKPNKPERTAKIVLNNLKPIAFDIVKVAGIPEVKPKDQLPEGVLKRYPKTDGQAVQDECLFLKDCKAHPERVGEPQWYAALSILVRLENGRELAHEYSKGHPGYSQGETDLKIEQALESSGPRLCSGINDIWTGCHECPHFQKIKTPILIRGKDHIATEFSGFHTIAFTANGQPKFIPNYKDLCLFFNQEHRYRGMGDSRMVYVWNGTHYDHWGKVKLEGFAQDHFEPDIGNKEATEFRGRMERTNHVDVEWFSDTTRRKINFQNGYLDIDSNEFLPHDEEIGFRYVLPYEYDPKADCPLFDDMMQKVSCNDQGIVNNLLEFAGYALSNDDYWCHKGLLMVGEGSNGKSTFLTVIRNLAGNENISSYTMNGLEQSEYNRAGLDGKLFNLCEEISPKSFLDTSMFKSLIGGAAISARPIYGHPYTFTNKAKMLMTCNEIPSNNDTAFGFKRRLLIVPFNHTFDKNDPNYDPHIDEKLKKELPGIFNRVYAAYQRFYEQRDFSPSDALERAKEAYALENDSMALWYRDNVCYDDEADQDGKKPYTTIKALHEDYSLYANATLGHQPVNRLTFGKRLPKLIVNYNERYTRVYEQNRKVRVLIGVRSDDGLGQGD